MSHVTPIRVAFVAFKGMSLLDLCGPLEALRVVSLHPDFAGGPLVYETHVVSADGGPVMNCDRLALVTEPLAGLKGRAIDMLIAPRAPKCRRVCSVCTGSFLLAAVGLLRGKRAATHWTHCSTLQEQYPEIAIEPDAIYVKDGNTWTSAGVTTGIDLALALIEEDLGREIAMFVARILVVYLRRTGGQSQYS